MNIEAASLPSEAQLDPRPLFARAVTLGGQVIAAVRPDQLDDRTPCRDYSVRQLMGHMVDVLRRVSVLGRGEDPFAMAPLEAQAVNDREWSMLWRLAGHETDQAWADPEVLTRTIVLPWATLPGAGQLLCYTSEVTVHTWDLAAATGQQPQWDDDVVAAALTAMQQALPAGNRHAHFQSLLQSMPPEVARRITPPFAEAVEIPAGSSLIDELVAWNGREP